MKVLREIKSLALFAALGQAVINADCASIAAFR